MQYFTKTFGFFLLEKGSTLFGKYLAHFPGKISAGVRGSDSHKKFIQFNRACS